MSDTVAYYPDTFVNTDDQTLIGSTQFYQATITANPNVAGGGNATSFSFTVPAHGWADGESVNIQAKFVGFTSDGVPTETRYIDISDTAQQLQTELGSLMAMPNNVNEYWQMNTPQPIIRIGTHLYTYGAWNADHNNLSTQITAGHPVSTLVDLGTPDFTKPITIGISHTLSAASANAVLKCIGAQITHYKLT